ncbi:MAG: Chitinase [Polaromonas sp.]|jgi:hypothetical protein|nr:Chitinase [Polaromonas sp.]MDB5845278.1 Chitinase [Polaromonas sp.]
MQHRVFSKVSSAGAALKSTRSASRLNRINTALAGTFLLCLSQAASAVEIAPYFHSWGGSLIDAKNNTGMNSAILAFAVTRGSCVMDTGFQEKLPDARKYVAAGGRLLLSFGGSAGVYAEIACTDDNQLFWMMEKVMTDSGIRRLDFDIEGHQLLNTDATARRARVLARLQAKYPDLYISFSLPSWLRGFNSTSMDLLRTTLNAGVRIDMVNVMAQSFGLDTIRTMVVPSTVAQAVIVTFQSTAAQMASIFPNKNQTQLYAMMGVSPMIGKNDDGSVFTLDDAKTVANFAKQNGVGMISYWSYQRDQAQTYSGATDLNNYTGVAQWQFQYHSIFKTAEGWAAPAPAAPAAAPLACGSSNWVEGRQYSAGSMVTYSNGNLYSAKFANPGYNPTISTYFWAPANCAGAAPAPAPSCSASNWVVGKQYAAGSVVTYSNGSKYIAKFANPGYNPTISTYFWSWYAC